MVDVGAAERAVVADAVAAAVGVGDDAVDHVDGDTGFTAGARWVSLVWIRRFVR